MLRGDGRGGGGGRAGVAAAGAGGGGEQPVVIQHGGSRDRGGGGGGGGPGVVGDLEGAKEGDPVVSPPLSPTVGKPNLKPKYLVLKRLQEEKYLDTGLG
jgi:hypothetical protein